jgi:multimeric flavodoxin WrbA
MSKKVLVISASPRKGGNSDLLADQFVKGALEAGNQVEKVRLSELKIHYCQGCQVCLDKGICIKPDDADTLGEKMVQADVIAFATPVYFYSMAGQLKVFFDRQCGRYTKMSNKDFYYFVTAWDPNKENLKPTIEAIRGFVTGCLDNPHEKGIVLGNDVGEKGAIKSKPEYQEAYTLGLSVK